MTILLGAMLAAGILLAAAPWLWPAGTRRRHDESASRLRPLLDSAGLPRVTVRALVATTIMLAVVAASAVWIFTQLPALALVAGITATLAPFSWLRARRLSLRRTRRGLWPDVCDLLIASVRAGMSLPDAVASLAVSAPVELRPAFAAFSSDLAASGHFDSAIVRLKAVLADPIADRMIETLRMTRQVGGTEITSVLRALSASVRADAALRAEVDARQSWVRGAAVLGVVAPWVILALLVMRPEGREAYASPEGVILVLGGAVVSVVAYRVMIGIGRLKEQRRWFA
jgi:tight adherence protein B